MAEVGVMPPPDGVNPDFHSWTYVQHTVIGVFAATFVLATIFLALRIYTALVIIKKLDWDIGRWSQRKNPEYRSSSGY